MSESFQPLLIRLKQPRSSCDPDSAVTEEALRMVVLEGLQTTGTPERKT